LKVETVRNTQVDGNGPGWKRSPLYSPRHPLAGSVRLALYAVGIAADIEPTASAGVLSQRRWHDNGDWLAVVTSDAQRQNIRDCSTERTDEVDRIDAHNPLTNKCGCGIRNRLDLIGRLRDAVRGSREPLIPGRSSLVAKLLSSQQGVFNIHTSRQCNASAQLQHHIIWCFHSPQRHARMMVAIR